MTEQETADAVASVLTGKFYVGQHVRWVSKDKVGMIETLASDIGVAIVRFPSGSFTQTNELFLFALEPA